MGIEWKRQHEKKITVQLEEINQKLLAKEGKLKRYRQRLKQYRQNRVFQNNERKFINNWEGMTQKHTNKQTPEKPNDFVRKYGNRKT